MKKLIKLLLTLTIITVLMINYDNGNLNKGLMFLGQHELAKNIEQMIDIITLKEATRIINSLPVK